MKKNNSLFFDLLYIPISLVFLFIMFKNYTQFLDISMVDETGYMELLNFNPFLYPGGYGPLYSLSYKIVYQFIPDFIHLHYFFVIVLTWLPPLTLFFFLRSRKVNFMISMLFSWLFFITTYIAAFDWWARTSHYSISLLFLFLVFINRYRQYPLLILAYTFLFFKILSYVRPELNMASYFVLLFFVIIIIYKKVKGNIKQIKLKLFDKLLLSFLVVLYLSMFLMWKSPTTNTGRMYFALGQHYTMNYNKWNGLNRIDFLYWERIFKEHFGESKTFSDMYKNNPKETIKHLTENIRSYCIQTLDFVSEIFLPNVYFKFSYIIKWIIIISVIVFFIFRIGWHNYIEILTDKVIKDFYFLFIVTTFALPSLVASFIIFPREHYFIMQLPFFIYLFYIILYPFILTFSNIRYEKLYLIIMTVILIISTPHVSKFVRYNNFQTYEKPNYLPYIEAIRKLNIKKTINYLHHEINLIYVTKNFKKFGYFSGYPFYDSIIVKDSINMLYVNNFLFELKPHKSDSTFSYFMNNYESLGWKKLQLKDKWGYLIYKKELEKNGE